MEGHYTGISRQGTAERGNDNYPIIKMVLWYKLWIIGQEMDTLNRKNYRHHQQEYFM